MSEPEQIPEPFADLIDAYLGERLDEARMKEFEDRLRADPEARRVFVRYARLHTDLHLEMRARQASERALDRIERLARAAPSVTPQPGGRGGAGSAGASPSRWGSPWLLLPAAGVLLALGVGWWLVSGSPGPRRERAIAWLVNAQNCQWARGQEAAGDMQAGRTLKLDRGLAEVRFECGATVVLEGPASLELLSDRSARLLHGKLTARVERAAAGFEIVSPRGQVIDHGTEFGVSVAENGTTDVYVFEGRVEARAAGDGKAGPVSLTRDQAARIDAGKVTLQPAGADAERYVRAIVPPPVIRPRSLRLTFDRATEGTIADADGSGTGLTHRLPGTGGRLPERDPNLRLDRARGRLELTTTNSDLNTQYKLFHGEYLGVRLSDLGFTGKEDFAVTVTIPAIPALEVVGQFGLYAGAASDRNIRGGLLSSKRNEPGQYTQFLVNNDQGADTGLHKVGLLTPGTDLRLTLKRTDGRYALTVENLTDGSASTLTIRHPRFLDDERDLFVGLFGANTQSAARKTLLIQEFSVTVWTVAPRAAAGRAD